jgi:excinuclease ABC subunit B
LLSPEQAMQKIRQLEQQMHQHARDLEFEEAASLRDEIRALRDSSIGLPNSKAG